MRNDIKQGMVMLFETNWDKNLYAHSVGATYNMSSLQILSDYKYIKYDKYI